MLLDYAAQLKCRTTKHVASTAVALSHLPSDIHHFVLNFSSHAQQLVASLHAELLAIASRRQAREKVKKNLTRTKQQLKKATQLIKQGKKVIEQVDNTETPSIHSTQHGDSRPDEEDATSVDHTINPPDNLHHLTEQIRQLKEQMEHLAFMQTPANESRSEGEEEEEDVPLASPQWASIPIASPMLANDVPMAPPLSPPVIPVAPPLVSSIPLAPPLTPHSLPPVSSIPDAPSFSPLKPSPPPPHSSFLSPTRPILSPLPLASSNLPTVFTRNIPGSDQLSHTDLIQVAARIKLRRTDVPRSPGGTPCKKVGGGGGGVGGGIGEALRMKFKNVNGMGGGMGMGRGSVRRGGSFGSSGDKENESWSTD